ncbi:Glu/Leu/Phe/Val family dehydrogenase [Desulfopila inferna]|uniref:Glu/Leu/Phe/Val family dehydrogenase n=1 Tax=Desulfopila inferna TaxID=468528 RepID=UPI0019667827|nr:Glu/Leu/Phe/Val dehydrogenase [Desulfopila inferna]MBM9604752.1 Glu/Leu/Phe/Val dehydrogenase [Desulfopila inferna]
MNKFTELQVDGYERVVRCDNLEVGFTAWVAVHDTTLGPALGGCRVWKYDSDEAALTDALRLSRGMTYKNALARLELGGGKAVVRTDLAAVDRAELFTQFGRFVEHLDGVYITAEDVNSTLADMEIVQRETEHVATVGGSGNPSPFTAYGVYCAIRACVRQKLHRDDLDGLTVALQGVGETGGRLAEMLFKAGCRIIAADINPVNLRNLQKKIDFEQVEAEQILEVESDIFSPCALGGILNDETISRLRCAIVAGSANNQLLQEEDGEKIRRRNILYAPDYAVNAGGVINISCEMEATYDAEMARKKTEVIGETLTEIIELSEREGLATNIIANRIAEEIIAAKKTDGQGAGEHQLIKTKSHQETAAGINRA